MTRTLEPYEEYGACGLVSNVAACGGLDEISGLTGPQRELAYEMARTALNHLTAGVVANCPRTVRPCRAANMGAYPWRWTGLTYLPPEYLSGAWLPACGCTIGCQCAPRAALDMNTHVAEIVGVTIDGVVLEEDEYRLAESRYLYRIDGVWPATQNMDLAPGESGTFEVTYRPGWALTTLGEAAYGWLASEFAKSLCNDGSCKLPTSVRSIARKGVVMEFKEGIFPDNKTGIRGVDLFVESVNPSGLRHVPVTLTPEIRRQQMRTV